jgi:hypothetical protein
MGALLVWMPGLLVAMAFKVMLGQTRFGPLPWLGASLLTMGLTLFLVCVSLFFAARSAWNLERGGYWDQMMKRMWVFVGWLMGAASVLPGAALLPSLWGPAVAAFMVGILWWERPDDLDLAFWHWWGDWGEPIEDAGAPGQEAYITAKEPD